MAGVDVNDPGRVELYLGNEAISRGALEAGCGFVSAYPGTPSSEIVPTMAEIAKANNIYVEWSTNEKVATEAATGASFAGIRSLVAMKQNGLNVASDYLGNVQMTGIEAGMILLCADDPGPLSSSNEEDTRFFAKAFLMPLLEPANCQEAYEMTKWGFELSEKTGFIVFERSLSRIGHTRSNVKIGKLPKSTEKKPFFKDVWKMYKPTKGIHSTVGGPNVLMPVKWDKWDKVPGIIAKTAPRKFDWYEGPAKPELLVITSGVSYVFTREALGLLKLQDKVGILKLGVTFPMDKALVEENLKRCIKVLFIEETDPFVEDQVMAIASEMPVRSRKNVFYGKRNNAFPRYGSNDVDVSAKAITDALETKALALRPAKFGKEIEELAKACPARAWEFCPGCPYRPFFWAMKTALQMDGRQGFSLSDVGCYTLSAFNAGYWQGRFTQAMGSSVGVACGLGQLHRFGFDQPVLCTIGDGTFFHSGVEPLISAVWNKANVIACIMLNSATAMTGHQTHPGLGKSVMGEDTKPINLVKFVSSMGARVEVIDPFDVAATVNMLLDLMKDKSGAKVLIVERECELTRARKAKAPFKMRVEVTKCIGEDCGCTRTCTRMFHCPGLVWDAKEGKAHIDEVMCAGCGACAQICPQGAIIKEVA
jgi:indolepyruvate ferredoxin oxidoreductase, alpha subunit